MSTVPLESNRIESNNQSNQPQQKQIHPLEFYAYGIVPNKSPITTFGRTNMGTQDKSSDLLNRNYFSVRNEAFEPLRTNFKVLKSIGEQSKETNNYLAPLTNYKTMERFHLPSNMTNVETYNIAKEKLFANDRISSLQSGTNLTKEQYINEKQYSQTSKQLLPDPDPNAPNTICTTKMDMKDNVLVFDKTRTHMLRNKGFWIPRLMYK